MMTEPRLPRLTHVPYDDACNSCLGPIPQHTRALAIDSGGSEYAGWICRACIETAYTALQQDVAPPEEEDEDARL
jgi:hypothetical protein